MSGSNGNRLSKDSQIRCQGIFRSKRCGRLFAEYAYLTQGSKVVIRCSRCGFVNTIADSLPRDLTRDALPA